jgi:hypothetical protein
MTRQFTPELGQTITMMLAAAVAVGGLLLIGLPLHQLRRSRS